MASCFEECPEQLPLSGYIISSPCCKKEEDPTAMYEFKSQRMIEDYVRLSLRPQLSLAEEKILLEIYQKAELSHDLHLLLTVIDDWIFRECEHLTDAETKDLVNQEARIHEFLYTLENPGEPAQLAREMLQLSVPIDPQPGGSYCGRNFRGEDFSDRYRKLQHFSCELCGFSRIF